MIYKTTEKDTMDLGQERYWIILYEKWKYSYMPNEDKYKSYISECP